MHINGWKTGKTTYGTYTNDHTTRVQEHRGGDKIRQASPTPKVLKGKSSKN
jgi:predicted GIY-YIG superfamily endonuclease